jgi:putative flippase GtrA
MALKTLHRFVRYCTVGVVGLAVKVGVLAALIELARLGYMTATAIAVEIAILHSFMWHLFWTWRDRSTGASCTAILLRLVRFHMANGAVGFASNLILMRFFVETLQLHYLLSNLAATGIAGLTNFLLSEFFVFVSIPHSMSVRNSSPPAAAGGLL